MTDLRSKSRLRLIDEGWHVETVERWCSFTRRKHDLWTWCDLLCLRGANILAVQVTSKSNRASHVHKIAEAETTPWVRDAGIGIHLHLWEKKDNRWYLTIEDLS